VAVRDYVAPLLGVRVEAAPPSCPDVLALLSRHLEDDINPERCAEMEKHLEGCHRCRGACESLKRTLALCRSAPAPEVPEDVKESVRQALRRFLAQPS
jgi:RNA polymerase sigma-70 factor (ECF subfamily)